MYPTNKRRLFWLPGPLLAIGLVSFALAFNVLAGLAFFCLAGALMFLLFAPFLQFILLRTKKFQDKPGDACAVALISVVIVLFVLVTAGSFNFA